MSRRLKFHAKPNLVAGRSQNAVKNEAKIESGQIALKIADQPEPHNNEKELQSIENHTESNVEIIAEPASKETEPNVPEIIEGEPLMEPTTSLTLQDFLTEIKPSASSTTNSAQVKKKTKNRTIKTIF